MGGTEIEGENETSGGGGDVDDEEILDLRQQFHNTVRENIIFLLFFLTLCIISWTIIEAFLRKKESEGNNVSVVVSPQNDDDESIVYRICFWLCVFALCVSIGAALLLPISIVSNEVLLLYPKTYYVQWLNAMLIQGLWNLIFLFANISLFFLLPFAYLFIESEGFSGHKKGLAAKLYEATVILILVAIVIYGITYVLASVLSPERSTFGGIFSLGLSDQLPFIYSCISFLGVLLLLLCTPLGFAHLFTVLSQLLVGPQFLRNLEEEYYTAHLEVESLKNKMSKKIENRDIFISCIRNGKKKYKRWPKNAKSNNTEDTEDQNSNVGETGSEHLKSFHHMAALMPRGEDLDEDEETMSGRIQVMEKDLLALEKLKQTPGWKRNLVYPLAFLFVLVLTALTVFMVIINTLQLVVGLKALPLSAQNFSLGLSSMSVLGPWGAALEVILIFYLIATSLIGLYNLPGVKTLRPRLGDSPTSHIIYNCALVLVLSSALPVLARILGITNFDLLGSYGQIEWLGNIYIVLLYNVVFSVSSALCLVTKFTSAIRQEIRSRLQNVLKFLSFWKSNNPNSLNGEISGISNSPLKSSRTREGDLLVSRKED